MFCSRCGMQLSEKARYCSECGQKVQFSENTGKLIHLKCEECGGAMTVERDRPIIRCPYCGKSDFIIEKSNITIQRIKSNAYRDVKCAEFQANKEIEIERINSNRKERTAKSELVIALIFAIFGCTFFIACVFLGKYVI